MIKNELKACCTICTTPSAIVETIKYKALEGDKLGANQIIKCEHQDVCYKYRQINRADILMEDDRK